MLADAAYDADHFRNAIARAGAQAVIPTQKSRAVQRVVDPHWYRERNLCERFWSKVEQYRRVATRYEKKAANFLAFAIAGAVACVAMGIFSLQRQPAAAALPVQAKALG